ncbi:MAG: 50S ribosomal protein L9 [Gammaproteobacteria bacterium]|jgi:large subunit ribosomal protein L9
MKIILLEKVHKLGNLGDTVEVKSGFGRNFLIPQGKAVPATKENIAKFEARRAELEKAAAEALAAAQQRAEKFKGIELTIVRKAIEEGKLFGSVGARDIVDAFAEKGMTVEKREVILPENIHEVGEYEIELLLHSDVKVKIPVKIEAEG